MKAELLYLRIAVMLLALVSVHLGLLSWAPDTGHWDGNPLAAIPALLKT